MTSRKIVVIALDGLGAMSLGPYGNAAAATPTWNQLAAQSLLIEFAVAESVQLDRLYDAYWYGTPAFRPPGSEADSLPQTCREQQLTTRLITDDVAVLSHAAAKAFDEAELIDSVDADAAAASLDETQLVQFAWQAIDGLAAGDGLTWIHCRGLTGPWDAPWEMRHNFVDEDDPDPPDFVAAPQHWLPDDPDPDVVWGISHAYAAQLSVADMALGILLDGIAAKSPDALVVVTSPRGYALGAHQFVGFGAAPLYSEQLHVPLVIRPPGGRHAGVRVPAIVPTHQLYELFVQWCQPDKYGDAPSLLKWGSQWSSHADDLAISIGENERILRTQQWFLREVRDQESDSTAIELYAKPDDRWERNEVASRCPDEVRELLKVADRSAIIA